MGGQGSTASRPDRASVRDELARVLEASAGVDEFVHGLTGFLVDLSKSHPSHPMLAALGEELGRASNAPMTASAMHDLRSILQGVTAGLDYAMPRRGDAAMPRRGDAAMPKRGDAAMPKRSDAATSLFERSGLLEAVRLANEHGKNVVDTKRVELLFEAINDARGGAKLAAELAGETLQIQRDCMTFESRSEPRPVGQHCDPIALNEVVSAAARLAGRLTKVELRLETTRSLEVRVPRSAIMRVLINLLRNAAHAIDELEDPTGAGVTVSSWASDEFAFVQIADSGPGIPAATLESIFELFFTTHAEGTGIGLFVCKTLVNRWGGMIHVDSSDGEGASFTFSLPLEVAQQP